jgi:hypothetical protein
MATSVVHEPGTDAEPKNETVKRWQRLFQYSFTEATECIKRHQRNLSRARVSDEHWEMVRAEKEAEGYDRDAYEYAMALGVEKPAVGPRRSGLSERQKRSKFLLKLEGPLDTASRVQEVGGLASIPSVLSGTGDSGETYFFCYINFAEKQSILKALPNTGFRPMFIRIISKAEKDLSSTSIYPTLGMDSTLPQYRLSDSAISPSPAQDEYPVWYFFYGTLADPAFLVHLLSLSEEPELRPASIKGGTIKIWAGKYKAVIDAPDSTCNYIGGYAYQVVSRSHEEILQYYETEKYEVARCSINMKDTGEEINGLTFRFAGCPKDLG